MQAGRVRCGDAATPSQAYLVGGHELAELFQALVETRVLGRRRQVRDGRAGGVVCRVWGVNTTQKKKVGNVKEIRRTVKIEDAV
jgi:hypothetical protein